MAQFYTLLDVENTLSKSRLQQLTPAHVHYYAQSAKSARAVYFCRQELPCRAFLLTFSIENESKLISTTNNAILRLDNYFRNLLSYVMYDSCIFYIYKACTYIK